ncbi:MAG TPA: hypothetical protein VF236_03140 [Gaiellaceae bacterium]
MPAGPFTLRAASCPPKPRACSEQRSAVRASRTVLRPGRKAAGTTLTFRLSRGAVLRISIVRVYPSCKRLGSYSVRAHAGVNRLPFRGRFRGRTLPPGGYRLVIRARGAKRDAAAVPIVIASGKMSQARVRKARTENTCREPIADIAFLAAGGGTADELGAGGSRVEDIKESVARAVRGVAGTARGFADRVIGAADDKPLDDPIVLTIIALLLGAIALLGTIVLAQIVRAVDTGDR